MRSRRGCKIAGGEEGSSGIFWRSDRVGIWVVGVSTWRYHGVEDAWDSAWVSSSSNVSTSGVALVSIASCSIPSSAANSCGTALSVASLLFNFAASETPVVPNAW